MTVDELGAAAIAVSVAMVALAVVAWMVGRALDRGVTLPAPATSRWFR